MFRFSIGKVSVRLYFGFFAAVMMYFYVMQEDRYCIYASLISCLLHEAGHLSAMMFFGCPPDEISFYFGGIRIKPSHIFTERLKMTVILLSGCCVNFLMCAVSKIMHFEEMFFINLALGIFNLMPFRALDGGHILALYGLERCSRAVSLLLTGLILWLLFAYRAVSPMSSAVLLLFALSELCL